MHKRSLGMRYESVDPLGHVPGSVLVTAGLGFASSLGLRKDMAAARLPSIFPAVAGAAAVMAAGEILGFPGYWPYFFGFLAGGGAFLALETLGVIPPIPRP